MSNFTCSVIQDSYYSTALGQQKATPRFAELDKSAWQAPLSNTREKPKPGLPQGPEGAGGRKRQGQGLSLFTCLQGTLF